MSELRVSVVPVGRIDVPELEAAVTRVSKVLHRPIELREPAPLPRSTEDVGRGQHQALALLAALRAALPTIKAAKLVGVAPQAAGAPAAMTAPDATVFVTDVDLFTPSTEGVLGETDAPRRVALVSVRRLREAFYRRKADPARQRARLAKEILRAIARIRGVADCGDPTCAASPSPVLADIDRKAERFCGACTRRLAGGAIRI